MADILPFSCEPVHPGFVQVTGHLRIYPGLMLAQTYGAMTRWASILIAGSMWVAGGNLRATEVGLIKINGAIGPATANYISRAIDVAAARKDACLIIQLDTPGGLLDSTKEIVQKFYVSPLPTVVYVSPSGASAGS